MTKNDFAPKKRTATTPDVVKEYTDSNGRKLLVTAEFKTFNDQIGRAHV